MFHVGLNSYTPITHTKYNSQLTHPYQNGHIENSTWELITS